MRMAVASSEETRPELHRGRSPDPACTIIAAQPGPDVKPIVCGTPQHDREQRKLEQQPLTVLGLPECSNDPEVQPRGERAVTSPTASPSRRTHVDGIRVYRTVLLRRAP